LAPIDGRLAVWMVTCAATVMERAWSSVLSGLSVSAARTVKLDVPVAEGVPEIAPVPVLMERPAGRLPEAIDQVEVPDPPLTASACE
jgi:hypothetical protein